MVKTCIRGHCPNLQQTRGLCHTHYDHYRRWIASNGSSYADPEPVRAHIKRLLDVDVSVKEISRRAHVNYRTIANILNGVHTGVQHEVAIRLLRMPIPIAAHEIAKDGCKIGATGTVRRLQALVTVGYTQAFLAKQLGLPETRVAQLMRRQPTVTAATARKVKALYDKLSATPPTKPSCKALHRADRLGWMPPLAWDDTDIDNPDSQPHTATNNRRPGFGEQYRELRELGFGNRQIAERMGIQYDSLLKRITYNGLRSAAP